MTSFLTSRTACELYAGTAAGAAASYLFTENVPVPNRNFLIVVGTVDTIVSFALGKFLTNKFMHPAYVVTISVSIACLMPIFYRYIGQRFGLQLPNYLTTSMCLVFANRAGIVGKHLGPVYLLGPKYL